MDYLQGMHNPAWIVAVNNLPVLVIKMFKFLNEGW